MSKGPAKLCWEFGDVTLWVSFGNNTKPFPVTVFRRKEKTDFQVHPHRDLTEQENQTLLAFMEQHAQDIAAMWPEAFERQLNWSTKNLTDKRRSNK